MSIYLNFTSRNIYRQKRCVIITKGFTKGSQITKLLKVLKCKYCLRFLVMPIYVT